MTFDSNETADPIFVGPVDPAADTFVEEAAQGPSQRRNAPRVKARRSDGGRDGAVLEIYVLPAADRARIGLLLGVTIDPASGSRDATLAVMTAANAEAVQRAIVPLRFVATATIPSGVAGAVKFVQTEIASKDDTAKADLSRVLKALKGEPVVGRPAASDPAALFERLLDRDVKVAERALATLETLAVAI